MVWVDVSVTTLSGRFEISRVYTRPRISSVRTIVGLGHPTTPHVTKVIVLLHEHLATHPGSSPLIENGRGRLTVTNFYSKEGDSSWWCDLEVARNIVLILFHAHESHTNLGINSLNPPCIITSKKRSKQTKTKTKTKPKQNKKTKITLLRVIPTMTCWVEVVRWGLSLRIWWEEWRIWEHWFQVSLA